MASEQNHINRMQEWLQKHCPVNNCKLLWRDERKDVAGGFRVRIILVNTGTSSDKDMQMPWSDAFVRRMDAKKDAARLCLQSLLRAQLFPHDPTNVQLAVGVGGGGGDEGDRARAPGPELILPGGCHHSEHDEDDKADLRRMTTINSSSLIAPVSAAPQSLPLSREHTLEMPTCNVCQKSFQTPSSLIQHMEAVHPDHGTIVMQEEDAANAMLAVAGACVVVAGAAAVTAAAVVKGLKPDVMQRYTLAADGHEGTEPVEERIIEYERKLPFKGYSSGHLFPNEPKFKRDDGSGLALLSKEDLLLPAAWTWLDGDWCLVTGTQANASGTDSDGWMYAFNWGAGYSATGGMKDCVRRRIWSRTRVLSTGAR